MAAATYVRKARPRFGERFVNRMQKRRATSTDNDDDESASVRSVVERNFAEKSAQPCCSLGTLSASETPSVLSAPNENTTPTRTGALMEIKSFR